MLTTSVLRQVRGTDGVGFSSNRIGCFKHVLRQLKIGSCEGAHKICCRIITITRGRVRNGYRELAKEGAL